MENIQPFAHLDLFSSLEYFSEPQYSPESATSDVDVSLVSAGDTATSPKSISAASMRPLPNTMTTQDVMQTLMELEKFVTPAKHVKSSSRGSVTSSPESVTFGSTSSSPVSSASGSAASSPVAPSPTSSTPSPKQPTRKSDKKPGLSYVGLIAKGLLSAPNQKMLLHDIYHYMTENYPYFKEEDGGWKNSVRHNLSLNECFIKAGKADVGKGNYWAVHPACVEDFTSGNYKRTRARRRAQRYTAYAKAIALGQSYGTTAYSSQPMSQATYGTTPAAYLARPQQPQYYQYAMPLYANGATTVPTLSALPMLQSRAGQPAHQATPTPYNGGHPLNYAGSHISPYAGNQSYANAGYQHYPMSMPTQQRQPMYAPMQTGYQPMMSPLSHNSSAMYPPNVTLQQNGLYSRNNNTLR